MEQEENKHLSFEELEAIRLTKFYEEIIKPFYEASSKNLKALIDKFGIEHYFQDETDGIVYKTDSQECFTVYNKPFTIKHTRFEGQQKGSLGMTEARENGFTVEGKPPIIKKEK